MPDHWDTLMSKTLLAFARMSRGEISGRGLGLELVRILNAEEESNPSKKDTHFTLRSMLGALEGQSRSIRGSLSSSDAQPPADTVREIYEFMLVSMDELRKYVELREGGSDD